ncbi:MAG: CopG family transcriptional regulator [Solimonas sp.]
MNTISLKVPRKLDSRLTRASKAQGVSKSEFVRRAVEKALDEAAAPAQKPTLLELAGDLIGSVKFGPPDLSTNPKYMEGYGEDNKSLW